MRGLTEQRRAAFPRAAQSLDKWRRVAKEARVQMSNASYGRARTNRDHFGLPSFVIPWSLGVSSFVIEAYASVNHPAPSHYASQLP